MKQMLIIFVGFVTQIANLDNVFLIMIKILAQNAHQMKNFYKTFNVFILNPVIMVKFRFNSYFLVAIQKENSNTVNICSN